MTKKNKIQLRLRVFAEPNGSGKSTVIQYVRNYNINHNPIDFGYYINADDIAQGLKSQPFNFAAFNITTTPSEFKTVVLESGLVNKEFPEPAFLNSFSLRKNMLWLKELATVERVAQIIADFLRKKLLIHRERLSFETVFSHSSKIDIMRDAVAAGYKVYLYFVSTESPEINIFRVEARKTKGGHDVPPDKIRSRYYRSLELLYEASQLSYQTYFFDNSEEGKDFRMFAHYKMVGGKKKWDKIIKKEVPQWFIKYYSEKILPKR